MFNQLRNDYRRHGNKILNPAFWAIVNYRLGCKGSTFRIPFLRWLVSKLYGFNLFLILITSGIELYRETKIGKDLHLIHSTNIHIHPDTVIGDRCGIMHDVTIGTNFLPGLKICYAMNQGTPIIGNDVFIGAGAKVLGSITIGDGAIISANSLVTANVPAGYIAIGVPAKIIKPR